MSPKPHTRKLKVYYGHTKKTYRRHPVIRLGGKYLEQMDFKIGDEIEVVMEPTCIRITKLEKPSA